MIVVLRMIALDVPPVHFCLSVFSRAALKAELGLERSYRRAPRGAADGKKEDSMAGICLSNAPMDIDPSPLKRENQSLRNSTAKQEAF